MYNLRDLPTPPLPAATPPPPSMPIINESVSAPGMKRKREKQLSEEDFEPEIESRHRAQSPVHSRVMEEEKVEGMVVRANDRKKRRPFQERCLLRFIKDMDEALPPFRATPHSAGFDLSTPYEVVIKPQEIKEINIGLRIQLPKNTYGQIVSRSSKALRGLQTLGGCIGEDYRGSIVVSLYNISNKPIRLCRGESIAQLICIKISYPKAFQVPELSVTRRGSRGFGSSDLSKREKIEL